MKKLLPLLFGSFIALLIFVAPGNPVKAAEVDQPAVAQDEGCACHDVTPILGAERNKMVADLISSEVFKTVKKQYTAEGYKWLGAHDIEIIKFNVTGMILTGVPFVNSEGVMEIFVFIDGSFMGISPQ
jgi:hypothetical protein